MKVVIIGVGNSGTKLLGSMVHRVIEWGGNSYPYHYEPLYWQGMRGEEGLRLNPEAVREHVTFPLLPDGSIQRWPWMEGFITALHGLAKFIRAASRVRLYVYKPIRLIWITRELKSFLGSMQKNFPRPDPDSGWHHRPGGYDDLDRLRALYPSANLSAEKGDRFLAEAAWWHLHNLEPLKQLETGRICHVRYEDLCREPDIAIGRVAEFIGVRFDPAALDPLRPIHAPVLRPLALADRQLERLEAIAGDLNRTLYPDLEL